MSLNLAPCVLGHCFIKIQLFPSIEDIFQDIPLNHPSPFTMIEALCVLIHTIYVFGIEFFVGLSLLYFPVQSTIVGQFFYLFLVNSIHTFPIERKFAYVVN